MRDKVLKVNNKELRILYKALNDYLENTFTDSYRREIIVLLSRLIEEEFDEE